MEYNRLKLLPKDILIKLLFDIEKDTEKRVIDKFIEDDRELRYLRAIKQLKSMVKNDKILMKQIIHTCIYKLNMGQPNVLSPTCIVDGSKISQYSIRLKNNQIQMEYRFQPCYKFNTLEDFNDYIDTFFIK